MPNSNVPCFTLRADNPRHIKVLVAGVRWAEQRFGAVGAFTQQIQAAITDFEGNQHAQCTLRADDSRHLSLLIAAVRWAEQELGARAGFTQQIRAVMRDFEVYQQTQVPKQEAQQQRESSGHPGIFSRFPRF
ncbi:MAG TPA: hypothetical protein VH640_25935 [Bryobacteraceae bacterium]|jgi:hypothetical protein